MEARLRVIELRPPSFAAPLQKVDLLLHDLLVGEKTLTLSLIYGRYADLDGRRCHLRGKNNTARSRLKSSPSELEAGPSAARKLPHRFRIAKACLLLPINGFALPLPSLVLKLISTTLGLP